MSATREVNISKFIDESPVSGLQKRVFALVLTLAVLDGLDAQVIGFVIPALSAEWDAPVQSFGLLLALSGAAMLLGSFAFGPVADKWGRKRVILITTMIFSVFTLASAFAPSMGVLIVLRFIAGLGLGGVAPNLIAIGSEYSPIRLRSTMIAVVAAGMSLGGFLGGFAASQVIPILGWEAMFIIGGVLPLLMIPLAAAYIPESPKFMAANGRDQAVRKVYDAMAGTAADTSPVTFTYDSSAVTKSPVREIFAEGRATTTFLLWGVFLINFLVLYFLFGWMPSLFSEAGQPASMALMAASLFNIGGMIGALTIGRITDLVASRWRKVSEAQSAFIVVMGAYTLGAVFIGTVAMVLGNATLLIIAVCLVGFGISGGSAGILAIASALYPVEARSTGIGWAMGVGRVGTIVGPAAGAGLIAAGMGAKSIFIALIVPTALAVVLLGILFLRQQKRTIDAAVTEGDAGEMVAASR